MLRPCHVGGKCDYWDGGDYDYTYYTHCDVTACDGHLMVHKYGYIVGNQTYVTRTEKNSCDCYSSTHSYGQECIKQKLASAKGKSRTIWYDWFNAPPGRPNKKMKIRR